MNIIIEIAEYQLIEDNGNYSIFDKDMGMVIDNERDERNARTELNMLIGRY